MKMNWIYDEFEVNVIESGSNILSLITLDKLL